MHVVFTKHVAHVLAKVTLNAFAKLLDAIDIPLRHAPRPVRGVWMARLESRYALFHIIVPQQFGNQVFNLWKALHGFDRHGLFKWKRIQARHAHKLWHSVDFSGARAAFAGLAVPSYSKIIGLLSLDMMNGIKHHHSGSHIGRIILKL